MKSRSQLCYDPNVDYAIYLRRFREEFHSRWETMKPSPSTGLDGYTAIGVLGVGSFGNVILVRHNKSGSFYATKVLNKKFVVAKKQVQSALNEKHVLQSIRFPNHTHLEFSSKDNDSLYMGMTLVGGGELFVYHRRVRKFSETKALFYASQVVLALEYLHCLQLIYRDLKPENLVIDTNGYIKLTDYGFTKYVPTRTHTLCGTPEYLSPEVLQMKPYGRSVDWWAFGVLIYEFVAGVSPFAQYNRDVMQMYARICDGDYTLPAHFSSKLRHLIKNLLEIDTTKRLGVDVNDIKQHHWFSRINWYAILNQIVEPPYIPRKSFVNDVANEGPRINRMQFMSKSQTCLYEDIFKDF